MNCGDMVKIKESKSWRSIGIFLGLRKFINRGGGDDYVCSEVMWFNGKIGTIQSDLLELIHEGG